MRTVAVAGVGLIGGSFGLALRKRGFPGRILGISSPRTIETAVARGAIDEGVSLEQAAAEADVILLAQPISVILETIERLVPLARPNCLITDAGSTKTRICESGRRLPLFVGGHPMAGKELPGIESADPDLFVGRPWILSFVDEHSRCTPLVGEYTQWLTACGAVPRYFTPEEHDATVAWTSHIPQLTSTALAVALHSEVPENRLCEAAGPGVRDMTRLALSPWNVWKDILETNSECITHALNVYIDKLSRIRENLQTQQLGEDFGVAANIAKRIRRGHDT